MKFAFTLLFIILFLVCPSFVSAQSVIKIEKIPNGESSAKVQIAEQNYPSEMTPKVTVQPNGKYLYTLSSGMSFLCESDKNILDGDVILNKVDPITGKVGCKLISKSEHIKDVLYDGGALIFQDSDLTAKIDWNDWRRTYDGVVDLELVKMNDGSMRIYALNHGEQVNTKPSYSSPSMFQNAVFNVPVNKPYTDTDGKFWENGCWSGYVDDEGRYEHCWNSFTSFANLQWNNYNPSVGFSSIPGGPVDYGGWVYEGPVIWPSLGYRGSDGLPVKGEANPYLTNLFIEDPLDNTNTNRYLYSFYRDWNCLRVSRATLTSGGRAGNWYNYFNGSFSVKSLPSGFTKERIRDYYASRGGGYDCIKLVNNILSLGITDDIVDYNIPYFEVAKTQKGDYAAAVETQLTTATGDKYWAFGITVSPDLVQWSPIEYFHKVQGKWGTLGGNYGYPTFLNKEGTSNKQIDTTNFYIMGTGAVNDGTTNDYKQNLIKLSYTCEKKPDKINGLSVNTKSVPKTGTLQMVFKEKVVVRWDKPVNVLNYAVRYYDNKENVLNGYKENTLTYNPVPDKTTDFWVHSVGYCSHWSDWSDADHYYVKFGKKGDFNLDNVVNNVDYSLFFQTLFKPQKTVQDIETFDINVDGEVNLNDIL